MAKKRKEKRKRNEHNGFKKHRVVKLRRRKTIVRTLGKTMQYYSDLIGMGSKWLTSAPSKMFKILEEEAKDRGRDPSNIYGYDDYYSPNSQEYREMGQSEANAARHLPDNPYLYGNARLLVDKKRNMSLTTSDKMTVASIVTFFLCNQYSKI